VNTVVPRVFVNIIIGAGLSTIRFEVLLPVKIGPVKNRGCTVLHPNNIPTRVYEAIIVAIPTEHDFERGVCPKMIPMCGFKCVMYPHVDTVVPIWTMPKAHARLHVPRE
jgi:hypothetical protein